MDLIISTTEERVDELKLDYIAHRSERGRIAVEALKASRLEKLKKMAGRKDD
jgi:COX assembly protein 1